MYQMKEDVIGGTGNTHDDENCMQNYNDKVKKRRDPWQTHS
jgi:hypothetical protein